MKADNYSRGKRHLNVWQDFSVFVVSGGRLASLILRLVNSALMWIRRGILFKNSVKIKSALFGLKVFYDNGMLFILGKKNIQQYRRMIKEPDKDAYYRS